MIDSIKQTSLSRSSYILAFDSAAAAKKIDKKVTATLNLKMGVKTVCAYLDKLQTAMVHNMH